ncbi:MAG: DUF6151 family protein [Pseudomonadota bacterium]
MTDPHPIRCACGALEGALAGDAWTNRVICYCDDCQAFAAHLGDEGILDARGGSDIVQTGPRFVSFETGAEHLACVRVTPNGPLRWYASCCGTPIGNTPANRKLAFVGLLHNALGDTAELDARFGPPRMHVFTKFARGEPKPRQRIPLPAALAFVRHLAAARLGGGYRVTPFFDASGEPVADPVLVPRPVQRTG